jgi:hypothetical protein
MLALGAQGTPGFDLADYSRLQDARYVPIPVDHIAEWFDFQ